MRDTLFNLQPWAPKTRETVQKLIDDIRSITPKLEVLFMRAAALGLAIDLDILFDDA